MVDELQHIMRTGDVLLVSDGGYDGEGLTEGPIWHPGGFLTFVRHRLNLLFRWSPDTGQAVVIRENTGHAAGCTLDLDGRLVMCEGARRRISRTEPDGSVTIVTSEWQGKRYNKPNDIVCRSDGSLYFTDPAARVDESRREMGFSGIFRVAPDGSVHLATGECEYPNGLAFSPDESTLYVAITRRDARCMTEEGPECRHRFIRAFDVAPDGSLVNNRVFADLYTPTSGGPDGLKVDADGRVYCASARGIWVFAADGTFVGIIATPSKARNLAFGGPDLTSLFICAGEAIYRAEMTVRGIGNAGI